MEGLLAAFDDMRLAKSPFRLSDSALLAELVALNQPMLICRRDTTKVQFQLDLVAATFRHSALAKVKARSFFIEKNKTNDDRVMLFGKIETGHLWTIHIKRKAVKRSPPRYKATVCIGSRRFRGRTVRGS
jgi:ABC-type microcin C transport system permease subunit YejE